MRGDLSSSAGGPIGAKLLIACLINLLAVSTVFMTQPIFADLATSFRVDMTTARYAFSVVSLCYTVSFFFLGPAADKFDLPKMACTGTLILSSAVLFSSCTDNFSFFLVGMALVGIGAAMVPASMFPYIAKISPQHKTGVNMGTIIASGTLGVIFGRVSMGIQTAAFGWRYSFRFVALVLLILGLVSFFSLVRNNDDLEPDDRQNFRRLLASSIRLLLDPRVVALLLVGFFLFVGFLGMITFLTYRLAAPPFNFSSAEIGWISFAGITALIAPFAGHLSQKTGPHKIVLAGLSVCLLSLQFMGWFPSANLTALGLLLLFLGVYTVQPLVFLIIGQSVSRNSLGSASSMYILFCVGGGSLSSIFFGPVWRSYGWTGITIASSIALLASLLIMSAIALREKASPTRP
jgi:YNFM family putative membrane transporter